MACCPQCRFIDFRVIAVDESGLLGSLLFDAVKVGVAVDDKLVNFFLCGGLRHGNTPEDKPLLA
jgi:hypothetical protein